MSEEKVPTLLQNDTGTDQPDPLTTSTPMSATEPVEEPPAETEEEEYRLSWSENLGFFALHHRRLLFWLILSLAAVLRLGRLGARSVWYDESFSLTLANRDLPTLLTGTAYQHHPPLGYLLLDGWLRLFGDSVYAGRLLSVLFGVGFVAVVYGLARDMFGSRTALLAMLFGALAPFQIAYSQEVRHYSLEALLGGWLVWSFYNGWRRNTPLAWLQFTLAGILALYNLYYSILGLAALDFFFVGYLLYNRRVNGHWQLNRFKGWFFANLAMAAAFAPWSLVLLNEAKQVSKSYWIPVPNPLEIFRLTNVYLLNATNLTTGPLLTLAALILGPLITLFLFNALRFRLRRGEKGQKRRSFEISLLLTYWFVPALLALGLSYLVAPLYLERSLIGFAAPCYILLARVIQTARRPALWFGLIIPALVVLLGSLGTYYFSEEYTTHYENEQAVAHIRAAYQPGDITIHTNKLSYQPFQYLKAAGPQYLAPEEPNNIHNDTTPESLKALGMAFTPVPDIIGQIQAGGRIWFVVDAPQPGQTFDYLTGLQQQITASHYKQTRSWDFWNGQVLLFEKNSALGPVESSLN